MTEVADGAFESATRLLRHRDFATADLDRRLADRGFDETERAAAIETLTRTGVLDDGRYATDRARTLAGRRAGDRFIQHELERAGIARELIEVAIGGLEAEAERARLVVARRGASPRTARYLAAKGYSEDAVRTAVAHADDERLG